MQINSPSASAVDPELANAALQNQIDVAVALKARRVDKQQGEAAIALIESAVQISEQLASGHIDVKL